ncbi:MAG: chitobiase/beta-hexosaminidase C-terminal domain-containing protein [Armatimonadota bacterium]
MRCSQITLVVLLVLATVYAYFERPWEHYELLLPVNRNSYIDRHLSVPVITRDGKQNLRYSGILTYHIDDLHQAGNDRYIAQGTIDIDQPIAAAESNPVESVIEMRDEHDKVLWCRLLVGYIDAIYTDGSTTALIVSYDDRIKPSLARFIVLDVQGNALWSADVSMRGFQRWTIDKDGDRYILVGDNWSSFGNGIYFAEHNQSKLIREAPSSENLTFLGRYNRRCRFVSLRPEIHTKENLPNGSSASGIAEMFEIDADGKVLHSPVFKTTMNVTFHMPDPNRMALSNQHSTSVTPWMGYRPEGVYRWYNKRWSYNLQVLDYENIRAPIIQSYNNAKDQSSEYHTGFALMDTTNPEHWRARRLAAGYLDACKEAHCYLYGDTDVLMTIAAPGMSQLILANRTGGIIGRYRIKAEAMASTGMNLVLLHGRCVLPTSAFHDEPIEWASIPITATPLISTTPTADGLRVRISCATKGASIRYSVDTRDPDSKGQSYRGEFTVPKGSTITARATAPRTLPSQIAESVGK